MNDVSGEILADAGRLISSDRAEQHGDMRANHENIANLWAAYLGTPVSTHDIALMMSLLKIARTKTGNPGYNNLPPIVVPFPMRALEPLDMPPFRVRALCDFSGLPGPRGPAR